MAPKRPPTNAGDSSAAATAGDSGRVTRSSTRLATAVTPPAEDPASPNKKKAKTTTSSSAAAVAPPAENPASPKKKKAKTTTTSSSAAVAPPAEDPAAQKKRKAKTTTTTSAAAEKPQPPAADLGGSKKIIIEHCKQCNAFKTRAIQVKTALEEGIPGIEVSLNPEKPRRGCFEIREEGGEVFISLLDMKRPFPPLKKLDMDEVISDILEKIR